MSSIRNILKKEGRKEGFEQGLKQGAEHWFKHGIEQGSIQSTEQIALNMLKMENLQKRLHYIQVYLSKRLLFLINE